MTKKGDIMEELDEMEVPAVSLTFESGDKSINFMLSKEALSGFKALVAAFFGLLQEPTVPPRATDDN